jgi:hypothetical protein
MRLFGRAATAIALTVALPGLLWAQTDPDNPVKIAGDNTAYGGSSAEFLQFGAGARGMALGGAFSTIVDDASAMHYNPAGLTAMAGPQAHVTVMPYFADTDYYWAGMAFPFSDNDFGFGVFLGRFGFSDQPIYTAADENGTSGETYGVNEVVAGVSVAHAFIDRFSAGVTLKYISDDLATGALGGAKGSTAAMDFGVNFHSVFMDRPIRLAFVVKNLGGNLSHSGQALRFRDVNSSLQDPGIPDQRTDKPVAETLTDAFPLPRSFHVGLNYDVLTAETTRLSLMAEFVESNNNKAVFSGGAEFGWESAETPIGAALRASYTSHPDNTTDFAGSNILPADNTKQNLDGLAVGGGLFYRIADRYRVQFDYAYRHYGLLGSADVFSVTFGWE